MKMITKTFPAGWHGNVDIDELVNAKLRKQYCFDAWFDKCIVVRHGKAVASCQTPPAIQDAFESRTSCTFSVTLPAEWWK